jgi:hypothetical protein
MLKVDVDLKSELESLLAEAWAMRRIANPRPSTRWLRQGRD